MGYVNNTLRFHADATGTASTDAASLAYNYGVYLLYNIGYGGFATIPFYNWYMSPQNLFPTSKIVTLYHNGDVISSSSTKRDLTLEEREFNSSEAGILNSLDGSELSPAKQILAESRVIGLEQGILWSSGPEMINISTPATKITGLMRRQNPDAEMQDDGQQPDFSLAQSLTCPATQCASPGSSNSQGLPACPSVLPDFRCKCFLLPR